MKTLVLFVFIISVLLVLYNHFLYPLIINLMTNFRRDTHLEKLESNSSFPSVSFIIAAFNEEKVIAAKLENTLKLDYPKDKLQIIVVSDGSDDATAEIVNGFSEKGVVAMYEAERRGKSAALNRGLTKANGEIIVFSDANNDFSEDAIKQLVKHFSDPEIGAVTGAKHIYASDDRESATGDGLYWKYEAFIKSAESHLGSITAAEGEILAVKKALMKPIDPQNINDDAAITFDIVKAGYRILYEEQAKSFEHASIDLQDDINVKIRMTAGGFQTISNELKFLFPPTSWFAFSFLSHKVLRWLTPHFLIIVFACNWLLLGSNFFQLTLFLQVAFYSLAIYGWLTRSRANQPIYIYVPMYFTVMNFALFRGFLAYLKGWKVTNWKKAAR